jgi:hypothetical protein
MFPEKSILLTRFKPSIALSFGLNRSSRVGAVKKTVGIVGNRGLLVVAVRQESVPKKAD